MYNSAVRGDFSVNFCIRLENCSDCSYEQSELFLHCFQNPFPLDGVKASKGACVQEMVERRCIIMYYYACIHVYGIQQVETCEKSVDALNKLHILFPGSVPQTDCPKYYNKVGKRGGERKTSPGAGHHRLYFFRRLGRIHWIRFQRVWGRGSCQTKALGKASSALEKRFF